MAKHTIDRVRDAEIKANEARDAAELSAHRIVEDAGAEAARMIAAAKLEAAGRESSATDLAKSKAAELIAQRKEAAERSADALREKTMNLKQNIINKLIEETLV